MIVRRPGPELSAAELYEIWRIRDIVFAVEQQCDEADVDGLDLMPQCIHLWIAGDDGQIDAYLRAYTNESGRHFGRVATRRQARGRGLATQLIEAVIDSWGDEPIAIGAQAHLHDWYAGFGFVQSGDGYVEAGIDHVPMRRDR